MINYFAKKEIEMHNSNIYIDQLKQNLSELNPYLVLLFGSYAYGTPHKDSDIDLLVVTNDDFIPKDFDARISLQLSVSQHIFEISKQVPIDLIVYTKPMYQKFIEQNSKFAHEITTKGEILYEGYNTGVA